MLIDADLMDAALRDCWLFSSESNAEAWDKRTGLLIEEFLADGSLKLSCRFSAQSFEVSYPSGIVESGGVIHVVQ